MPTKPIPITEETFEEINNAILDLQRADYQSFDRPLRRLAQAVDAPELREINQRLLSDVDLDAFLSEGAKSGGSMVGSQKLPWPDDRAKELGLTLALIKRMGEQPDWIVDFSHSFYYAGSKIVSGIRAFVTQALLPFNRDYKAYVLKTVGTSIPRSVEEASRKVFIVHGHEEAPRETVARFLERIDFEAIILHEQASKGMTIAEKLSAHGGVGFAVVLLTPDDVGRSNKETDLHPRARQNVVLELGYFIGRLGRERVCVLRKGEVEIPSDYMGVVYTEFDQGGGWRQALGKELQAAGYHVDWNKIMKA